MPAHFGRTDLNIVTSSSPTGTQFNQAVGCAEGIVRARVSGLEDRLDSRVPNVKPDEIVLVCTGEGTTSEGEFWEALNSASTLELPILFLVEDNGYAISVPVEVNTAGGSISKIVRGFPHLYVEEVDGTDLLESYDVVRRAAAHVRSGRGPALVHAHVIRPYNHSMSDDERLYKPESERDLEAARDPLVTFGAYLVREGVLESHELESLKAEIKDEVADAADRAATRPQPSPESIYTHVYSPDIDPASSAFETEPRFESEGKPTTMVDLLNACLRDEMRRRPDDGRVRGGRRRRESRRNPRGGEGQGWRVQGHARPAARVRLGPRVQLAARRGEHRRTRDRARRAGPQAGRRDPVLRLHLARLPPVPERGRDLPLALQRGVQVSARHPYDLRGYLTGGAIYHSQTGASLFTHTPGMHVICPSNAVDANGLLRTAIRCDDPVLFLEHKHLYRQTYNKGVYPGPDYMIPFGKAAFVETGDDLTIVTYGAMVERTRKALAKLDRAGEPVSADLIDLRSLNPVDMDAITRSVKKTNRVLVAYEDAKSWGYGAEISARLADELFEWLDAPIRRITSTDTFIGYAPSLENASLPQVDDIAEAIVELATW